MNQHQLLNINHFYLYPLPLPLLTQKVTGNKKKDCGLRAFCYQKLLEALEPTHFQHVLYVSMI